MQWEKLLVVDIECTCFRPDDEDKPEGWESEHKQEIIELGLALVHIPERRLIDTTSIKVRPEEGPIGKFCTELTSLTAADVAEAPLLSDALVVMKDWLKERKFAIEQMPWGSWGDYDRVQLQRECLRKNVAYPFARAHYNIKGFFSMLLGTKKGYGVGKALRFIGVPFEGRPHVGVDDARNTVTLLLEAFKRCKCN